MLTDSIFMWIYCMDIPDVLTLLALFTAIVFMARLYCSHRLYIILAAAFLALWAAAVIMQTVVSRVPGSAPEAVWAPFRSYLDALSSGGQPELLRSNFMNVVLFYPAGLLLGSLLPERRSAAASFAFCMLPLFLLSAAVEFVQYRWFLGLAQTDDVIHNTLGAALGAAVSMSITRARIALAGRDK